MPCASSVTRCEAEHGHTCVQEELTEQHFQDHVSELVKSKLQKPRKLGTYLARWRLELLMARFDWHRVDTEVAVLRQLTRRELLRFVDSVLLDASYGRQLAVHVKGSAELARDDTAARDSGDGTCSAVDAAGAARDTNGHAAAGADDNGTCSRNGSVAGNGGRAAGRAGAEDSGAAPAKGGQRQHVQNCALNGVNGDHRSDGGKAEAAQGVGACRDLVVAPDEIPAFRMKQQLWPLTRRQWF